MAGLDKRIEALEKLYGGGGGVPPCAECGGGGNPGGDDDDREVEYELTFPGDRGDHDLGSAPQEEFCGTCGRQVVQVLYFPEDSHQDNRRKRSSAWRR